MLFVCKNRIHRFDAEAKALFPLSKKVMPFVRGCPM
jgi:hypothetical protein